MALYLNPESPLWVGLPSDRVVYSDSSTGASVVVPAGTDPTRILMETPTGGFVPPGVSFIQPTPGSTGVMVTGGGGQGGMTYIPPVNPPPAYVPPSMPQGGTRTPASAGGGFTVPPNPSHNPPSLPSGASGSGGNTEAPVDPHDTVTIPLLDQISGFFGDESLGHGIKNGYLIGAVALFMLFKPKRW